MAERLNYADEENTWKKNTQQQQCDGGLKA